MPNLKIHSVEPIDLDWDELTPKEQDRLLRQKRSRENAKMEAELYPPDCEHNWEGVKGSGDPWAGGGVICTKCKLFLPPF